MNWFKNLMPSVLRHDSFMAFSMILTDEFLAFNLVVIYVLIKECSAFCFII